MASLVPYSDSESEDEVPYVSTSHFRDRSCPSCSERFNSVHQLQNHIAQFHPEFLQETQIGSGLEHESLDIIPIQQAIDGLYSDYEVQLRPNTKITVDEVFTQANQQLIALMAQNLFMRRNYKIQFIAHLHFSKTNADGSTKNSYPIFSTFLFGVYSENDFSFVLRHAKKYFQERIENYTALASNLTFQNILKFVITIVEMQTFSAGGCSVIPTILQKKARHLINVPSDDNLCFKRAVYLHPNLRPPFPSSHRTSIWRQLHRSTYYDTLFTQDNVNWTGIKFPFNLSQARKFETQNPDIGLCIIGFDNDVEMIHTSEQTVMRTTVDDVIDDVLGSGDSDGEFTETEHTHHKKTLLEIRSKCFLLHSCKENRPIRVDLLMNITPAGNHFLYIKSLRGLLFDRRSEPMEVCRFCLHQFTAGNSYDEHVATCAEIGMQKTSFPKQKTLKFKHFNRTIKVPYVVFADFESTLQSVAGVIETKTQKLNVHSPGAYSFLCVDYHHNIVEREQYISSGESDNVAQNMIRKLVKLAQKCSDKVKEKETRARTLMILTPEQERQVNDPSFRRRQSCFFCHEPFRINDKIHAHHSHFDFTFHGFAHAWCNKQARQKRKELTIVMHNFKAYDSKIIVEGINNCDIIKDVDVIASSGEKFMAVFLKTHTGLTLRFIDSLSFFNTSLDSLAKTMSADDFTLTKQVFEPYGDVNLLLRKGIYCYSYVDSVEKYQVQGLPPADSFKNDLTGSEVSSEEYAHAWNVYNTFNCQTFGDYTLLYCMTDVTILADYFLKIRNIIEQGYGLDMCHYFSLPMLVYDAGLKLTRAKLQNIQDPTMYNFFESSIRGGLVSVGDLRVCKPNNPLLPFYDRTKPTTWCVFLDVTNLYGFCLKEKLPYNMYEWVGDDELDLMRRDPIGFFNRVRNDGDIGYFVEVDAEIPNELHHQLNGFPPMPYKRNISPQEVTIEMQDLIHDLEVGETVFKTEKLLADFHPRKNYVCHFRALKQWIKLGCKITKIKRAVKFYQTAWLKPLIEFNTRKRDSSTSEVESAFWKLASNSIFGKFIENKRMRVNVRLITDRARGLKFNKKPTVQNVKIIHSNLVLLTLKKLEVVLDRPIAVGATCLELSKTHMSKIYYDHLKVLWGDNMRNVYGDTDSIAVFVETPNVYQDMKNHGQIFDLSIYDRNDPFFGQFYDASRAKELGLIKDEMPKGPIGGFAVLKPKMYGVQYFVRNESGEFVEKHKKKAKGIPMRCVETEYTFNDFIKMIDNPEITHVNFKSIRSFDQRLYTIIQNKRGINSIDTKRFILPDNVNTLAFGHVDIDRYYS